MMASGAGIRVVCFLRQTLGVVWRLCCVHNSPIFRGIFLFGGDQVKGDAFSRFHPAVNFIFFLGAIGFGVVLQHPAYIAAGTVSAAIYYLLLKGPKGIKLVLGMIPMFLLISLINPLFNLNGRHILFYLFGRPYTFEALCYGMTLGAMFAGMMIWFACYNVVLTSDKFICLFGSLIPALSLLLVMVLRLIPSFMRKTTQIIGARNSIGKGVSGTGAKEKAASGMTILSALTDWALEGSIVTADSMRARGYGAAKRTSFQIYRMTARDWVVLALEIGLAAAVLLTVAAGGAEAAYTPNIQISPITGGYAAYWAFLLIPTAIQLKEEAQWRIIRSKI